MRMGAWHFRDMFTAGDRIGNHIRGNNETQSIHLATQLPGVQEEMERSVVGSTRLSAVHGL